MKEILKVSLAAAFVVIVLGVMFYLSNECEKKNGILVRTPFGYTCVEKVK